MKKLLAVFVTLSAASMTSVAAWDRGGTLIDKTLLVAMSVVIVLAVHLLPAMSRRPSTWFVWGGCLLCAIYGHLTFLTHASLRASENRAQQSSLAVGTERQVEVTREALANIKARPVATVAAELSLAKDKRSRAALREEIAEGKHAEALRDNLVRLSVVLTAAIVSGATDPVTARLSQVTSWSENSVAVAIGLSFSILIELIGAILWYEALRKSGDSVAIVGANNEQFKNIVTTEAKLVTPEVHETSATSETILVTNLKESIKSGACEGTVSGIRDFLGCSQLRASELRRALGRTNGQPQMPRLNS